MKGEQSTQLDLTVVALVALVAIVGLVALVMNAASVSKLATGSTLASAQPANAAGSATAGKTCPFAYQAPCTINGQVTTCAIKTTVPC